MTKLRLFLIAAVLFSCFVLYVLMVQPFTPALQRIEYIFNTAIPPSAAEVRSQHNDGFRGDSFYLRMKLPSGDFPDFINHLCPNGEASLGTDFNWQAVRTTSFDWWITDATPITISGRCVVPSTGLPVEIFVDQTNADVYELYILGIY